MIGQRAAYQLGAALPLAGLAAMGCNHREVLPWPAAPAGARSVLIVTIGSDGPAVLALDGVTPGPFSVSEGALWLRYSTSSLAELALAPGAVPLGPERPLPEAVATFERIGDRWEASDSPVLDPRLATIRLAAPPRLVCLGAGGCYGLSPDKEQCNLPCPCPKAPLATAPYPSNECPLPSPREAPCYRARGPLQGLSATDKVGSVVVEAGRSVLYFSTDRFGAPGHPRLARAELDTPPMIRPGSIEPIDLGLDPRARAERPHVRADGLELWFQTASSTSSGSYEIWAARRTRLDAPFGRPRVALAASEDAYRFPILLGDYRTLVFRSDLDAIGAVPRSSTIAGDVGSFNEGVFFALTPNQGAWALSLGCDRQSIVFSRTLPQPRLLMVATLASLHPLELDVTRPTQDANGAPFEPGESDDTAFAETPDCLHLLISDPSGTNVYDTVACPE